MLRTSSSAKGSVGVEGGGVLDVAGRVSTMGVRETVVLGFVSLL